MRVFSLSLLVLASSASAQTPPSVDCDAIKNSTVAFELAYHSRDGTKTAVQAYRNKSGNDLVWSRRMPPSTRPNPSVFVTRATYIDGIVASSELSTSYAGKYAHRTATYKPDGLPANFDRRSDVTFKMHAVTTDRDGTAEEKTSTIAYTFKSEGTITVGSCDLQAIHGEIETVNEAARTRHSFQVYFPELRVSATADDAEPIVDSLSTVFSEIKPVN